MSPTSRRTLPLPSGRGWWLVVAGIAAGLVLFLVLLAGQRGERDLREPDDARRPAAAAPVLRPLPVPPAMDSGVRDVPDIPESTARLEEPAVPRPTPAAPATHIPGEPGRGSVAATSAPVPVESPGPRYPPRALRRGESGEVMLRIEVDARGRPARVAVASGSGSRDLDRAAIAAARRWRFRPAMRDGEPVDGVVNVPIVFDSGR